MRRHFVMGKIWNILHKNPEGTPVSLLAEKMCRRKVAMSTALHHMQQLGYARNDKPKSRNAKWYAIGDLPPVSKAGTHPNTLRNLTLQTPEERDAYRRMAYIALGHDPDRLNKDTREQRRLHKTGFGVGGCALAECWTNTLSPTQRDKKQVGSETPVLCTPVAREAA